MILLRDKSKMKAIIYILQTNINHHWIIVLKILKVSLTTHLINYSKLCQKLKHINN